MVYPFVGLARLVAFTKKALGGTRVEFLNGLSVPITASGPQDEQSLSCKSGSVLGKSTV
jgi:hypothetical protein